MQYLPKVKKTARTVGADSTKGLPTTLKHVLATKGDEDDVSSSTRMRRSALPTGSGSIFALTSTKCGTFLLSGGSDSMIRLWNPHKPLMIKTFAEHSSTVHCIAVQRDNSEFASGSSDKSVLIWDVRRDTPTRKLWGHSQGFSCLLFLSFSCNFFRQLILL